MAKNMKMQRALLVDGSNILHRGHHAVKDLSTTDGFPTNAIKGGLAILLADIRVLQPDYIVVVFDERGKKNWRQIAYPMYKRGPARVAAREKNRLEGDPIGKQFEPFKEILAAMGIVRCGIQGIEADDLIGTLAVMFWDSGIEVVINSMDKDFAQLVNTHIKMMSRERVLCGTRGVVEKFGVRPDQIVDYLTLQGDSVDNIPGVPKCGPGTAAKWLTAHEDLRGVMLAADTFTPVLKANFAAHKKNFKWTKPLVTIKTDVDTGLAMEDCRIKKLKPNRLKRLCLDLELKQTHLDILHTFRTLSAEAQTQVTRRSLWKTKNSK